MAYPSLFIFLLCSLLLLISSSLAQIKPKTAPKTIVLPVSKDPITLQYLTQIKQRTPLVPVLLTIDLGARSLWTDCESGYVSSTIRSGGCNTTQCRLAQAHKTCYSCTDRPQGPGCNKNTCYRYPINPVIDSVTLGELAMDIISINSTDGKNPGNVFTVPQFLFFCARGILTQLAEGVTGMVGLGRTKVSFPLQLASDFKLKRKFGICLSSLTKSNGVIVIGDGQYNFHPNINASSSLTYTPLILNKRNPDFPVNIGEASSEYYIGVKSIKINGKAVKLNTTLLSLDSEGHRGTRISTVHPYTILETSIYKAVVNAFVKEFKNATRVSPVLRFDACFSSKNIASTRAVPIIDFVLQNNVSWRMFGSNSMVKVKKDVLCLGFVDRGGVFYLPSIVIGGHQIEENLLTFDIDKSMLGFSSSLLFQKITCANYKLT